MEKTYTPRGLIVVADNGPVRLNEYLANFNLHEKKDSPVYSHLGDRFRKYNPRLFSFSDKILRAIFRDINPHIDHGTINNIVGITSVMHEMIRLESPEDLPHVSRSTIRTFLRDFSVRHINNNLESFVTELNNRAYEENPLLMDVMGNFIDIIREECQAELAFSLWSNYDILSKESQNKILALQKA